MSSKYKHKRYKANFDKLVKYANNINIPVTIIDNYEFSVVSQDWELGGMYIHQLRKCDVNYFKRYKVKSIKKVPAIFLSQSDCVVEMCPVFGLAHEIGHALYFMDHGRYKYSEPLYNHATSPRNREAIIYDSEVNAWSLAKYVMQECGIKYNRKAFKKARRRALRTYGILT